MYSAVLMYTVRIPNPKPMRIVYSSNTPSSYSQSLAQAHTTEAGCQGDIVRKWSKGKAWVDTEGQASAKSKNSPGWCIDSFSMTSSNRRFGTTLTTSLHLLCRGTQSIQAASFLPAKGHYLHIFTLCSSGTDFDVWDRYYRLLPTVSICFFKNNTMEIDLVQFSLFLHLGSSPGSRICFDMKTEMHLFHCQTELN